MYYLDTNICIYFLNGSDEAVRDHIIAVPPEEIRTPTMVKAELLFGAYKSEKKQSNLKKLRVFLGAFECEDFTSDAAEIYAKIRADLEQSGTPIGPNDLIIAATVLSKGGTLVTHNTKEFKRIKNLNVIDWTSL